MAEFAAPSGSAWLALWTRSRYEQALTPLPGPSARERDRRRSRATQDERAHSPPASSGPASWPTALAGLRRKRSPTHRSEHRVAGATNLRCGPRSERVANGIEVP